MHLPASMDGGPHQMVEPGGPWRPTWQINQPGATLWFHPHPHGKTEGQLDRGLTGLFIIDDPNSPAAGLPRTYGVDDIPLILQDRDIDAHGALVTDTSGNAIGTLGRTITVNGIVDAVQVRSRNPYPHNFHIHDVQFEIVSIAGDPPPPELTGRKDTVYLEPLRSYHLIMRFSDHTDPSMPYMYHCHLVRHERRGVDGPVCRGPPGRACRTVKISSAHAFQTNGFGFLSCRSYGDWFGGSSSWVCAA